MSRPNVKSERGAGLAEYALILVLVVGVVGFAFDALAAAITGAFAAAAGLF